MEVNNLATYKCVGSMTGKSMKWLQVVHMDDQLTPTLGEGYSPFRMFEVINFQDNDYLVKVLSFSMLLMCLYSLGIICQVCCLCSYIGTSQRYAAMTVKEGNR